MSKFQKIQFTVFAAMLGALNAPVSAQAAPVASPATLHGCYVEAQWPVTSSAPYVYGNARQREQLRNGYSAEVYQMQRLCYRMTASEPAQQSMLAADCGQMVADSLKAHGDKAREHAVRQRDFCEVLSGQEIKVSGL